MVWLHVYDPLSWPLLSTLVATLPLVALLGLLAGAGWSAHAAAGAGLATALAIAVGIVGMPADAALAAALYGAGFGLFPIGWIIVTAMFLYQLALEAGALEIMKRSVTRLSADHRMQALLIAFSFGAFLEGAAGFGAPVAISAALLTGAGFPALEAACLALIANTAPVAFGALGTPIITLAKVTGLDEFAISQMAGRQLPFFSLIVPAWMVATMAGWRGLLAVWPAVLVCGGSFAAVQFAMANYVGAALVDVVAGIISLVMLAGFLRWWQPRECWQHGTERPPSGEKRGQAPAALKPDEAAFPKRLQQEPAPFSNDSARAIAWAWAPWAFLSVAVFCWGLPAVKASLEGRPWPNANPPARAGGLDGEPATAMPARVPAPSGLPLLPKSLVAPELPVPRLDGRIAKVPPATREPLEIERAVYRLNWLSAAGTGILAAALIAVPWLGISWRRAAVIWWENLRRLSLSLLTIALMLALAFVTRYSGTDVTLGLALTRSGWLYPVFSALLGWLGVALTGSDTSSNAMFGSLQRVTAEQLGLNPLLICTANSTGGVMGKMIDAQSIVVSATATGVHRQEGAILRRVFPHSLALAILMGLLVWLQSGPLAWMVP
jgi:lactate permease